MKKGFLFFTIKFSIFKNTENSSILFQLNFNFYPDSMLADITITYAFFLQAVKRTESIMPHHPYVFAQFLQLLPRYEFQSIVNKYKGDYRIYEEFAKTLMQRVRREYVQTQLAVDVDNAVYALDASVVDLMLSLYPWAKFRKTKGAIKLHTMLDLRGNIPAFLTITDGKVHDVKAAPQVPIEPQGIYVVR